MDQRLLMEAIRDGSITTHGHTVQGRYYQHHGQLITYWELNRLHRLQLIDLPLGGPPTLTPEGSQWLGS